MQLKLYIQLPRPQAKRLVEKGFGEEAKTYRLSPAEYVACSAFSQLALVELQLELSADEARQFRLELEMPGWDEGADDDQEWGESAAEPIYWYEFPADVLNKVCRKRSIVRFSSEERSG